MMLEVLCCSQEQFFRDVSPQYSVHGFKLLPEENHRPGCWEPPLKAGRISTVAAGGFPLLGLEFQS